MLSSVASDDLRAVSGRLATQTEALAAVAAALRLRVSGERAPGAVEQCLDDVLEALEVRDAVANGSAEGLSLALAPIRALFLQSVDLLTDPARAPGWAYTDADLLQSLGQNSAAFAEVIRDVVSPQLEGLEEALARSGAAFLDVGVGVAALSIAMARLYPELRVLGIDPWDVALDLAQRNVAAAGLEGRITLRRQRVEELPDESAFDLAFLAGPFLGESVVEQAYERVGRALRPGGWVLFGMYSGRDPLETSLARLRAARSGAAVLDADDAEARLRAADFADVRTFAAELGIPSQLVVGRRP
jgi:SAM-dependent methyltransferase